MKVKVFLWVALQNKILTQDVLLTRGVLAQQGCVLCGSHGLETADHILQTCIYTCRFWLGLMAGINIVDLRSGQTNALEAWLIQRRNLDQERSKLWDIAWSAGCWVIWKERNERTFARRGKTVPIIINETLLKANC